MTLVSPILEYAVKAKIIFCVKEFAMEPGRDPPYEDTIAYY